MASNIPIIEPPKEAKTTYQSKDVLNPIFDPQGEYMRKYLGDCIIPESPADLDKRRRESRMRFLGLSEDEENDNNEKL